MAKGCFVVRAEVPDEGDRKQFDHWYATDHLPWAIKVLARSVAGAAGAEAIPGFIMPFTSLPMSGRRRR